MELEGVDKIPEKYYVPRLSGKRLNIYLSVLAVNVSSLVSGIVFGWSAVILPLLQSEASPIGVITNIDASWLASINSLSRLILVVFYKYCNQRYGCKITGYLVAAPFIIGSVLMMFANSLSMMFWSRFIMGVAMGGMPIMVPSFTSDAAEDHNKGILGIFFGLTTDVGTCFCYILVYVTSYEVLNISTTLLSVAFVFIVWWLPESPLFLMTRGKMEEAKESLNWLRNGGENVFEIERMKKRAEVVLEMRKRKVSFSEIINNAPLLRGFLICIGLIINKCFSGIGPILSFTVQIFQDAGSTLSPNIATILVSVVAISGGLISCVIIEHLGRRLILITSNLVMASCLIVLGTHFYFKSLGWNLEAVGWIPVASLSVYILSNGVGLGPIPFLIPTELVHTHYLGVVQSTNLILMSLLHFAVTFMFTPLAGVVGTHGCFWLFAMFCVISTICIFMTVPETKKRSLEDVLEQMESKHYVLSVISDKK